VDVQVDPDQEQRPEDECEHRGCDLLERVDVLEVVRKLGPRQNIGSAFPRRA